MTAVFYPALAIGAIGLFLGALLAVAAKVFQVEEDERVPKLVEVLPGANCGGCGYPGCAGFAAAVVEGQAGVSGCTAGGQAVADRVAAIMGVKAEAVIRRRAVVLCLGTDGAAPNKYDYYGIRDCVAASKLVGGPKACEYGCMGFGSCEKVCAFGAIKIENGIAVIDENKCTACGACVAVCPKSIIKLVPAKNTYIVKCRSCDRGADMRALCKVGCIGCKMCVKACPCGAISVTDNLAEIDYSLCINCGKCAEVCPRKIIIHTAAPIAYQN